MRNSTIRASFIILAALFAGCASDYESPYRDPGEMRGRFTDFSTYDVQQCATKLVDSLLGNRNLEKRIKEHFGDKTPLVAIRLKNLTYQLSATDKLKSLMFDTIESRLLDAGRFDFIDRSIEEEEEMDLAEVDYLLDGKLEEFREGDGRIHDTYYKMTVKLYNTHTRRIDWSGEKEIRKVSSQPIVGW